MCDKYCNCENCGYDKKVCEMMGDGTPFCNMFKCTVENCNRLECISFTEELEIYLGH